MASEDDFAEHLAQVLPKLVEVGARGALLWCYADYSPELHDRPPCDEAHHERFFGLVRPDGTLKSHTRVISEFAATKAQVKTGQKPAVVLDVEPEQYYHAPVEHIKRLYRRFLAERPV